MLVTLVPSAPLLSTSVPKKVHSTMWYATLHEPQSTYVIYLLSNYNYMR